MKRDISNINPIIRYCEDVESDIARFSDDIESPIDDKAYQRSTHEFNRHFLLRLGYIE